MFKNFVFVVAISFLSACGGDDGLEEGQAIIPNTDGTFHLVGSDSVVQGQVIQSGQLPPEGVSTPSVTETKTVRYPEDFPLDLPAQSFLHTQVYVEGLPRLTDFLFSVSPDAGVFVSSLSENSESITSVCAGPAQCEGTPSAGKVLLQAVASDSPSSYTFNIEPTGKRPLYNEGSVSDPVLIVGDFPLQHAGAVGVPTAVSNNAVKQGESHYHVDGLQIGNRYLLKIENRRFDSAILHHDVNSVLKCDRDYSGERHCQFVARENSIVFSVLSDRTLNGDAFDLSLTELASSDTFEGVWFEAKTLTVDPDRLTHHLLKVDNGYGANSYYTLEGMEADKAYRITTSGRTGSGLLYRLGKHGGYFIDDCSVSCIVEQGEAVFLKLKGNNLSTNYSTLQFPGRTDIILSVEAGVNNDGELASPRSMTVSSDGLYREPIQVKDESYYALSNLDTETQWLISADNSRDVQVVDEDGNGIGCDKKGSGYCVFSPSSSSAIVKITTASPIGKRLELSVLAMLDSEDSTVALDDLPIEDATDWSNEYTITGLEVDKYYLAKLLNVTNEVYLSTWAQSSSSIQCSNSSGDLSYASCILKADDAALKVRARTAYQKPGVHYRLDIQGVLPFPTPFASKDTPQLVPDNSTAGAFSEIVINNESEPVGQLGVLLMLDHSNPSEVLVTLITPSGKRILLSEYRSGVSNGVVFSDTNAIEDQITTKDTYRFKRPSQPLHPLAITSRNGRWQLEVIDTSRTHLEVDQGDGLIGWGLVFGES